MEVSIIWGIWDGCELLRWCVTIDNSLDNGTFKSLNTFFVLSRVSCLFCKLAVAVGRYPSESLMSK